MPERDIDVIGDGGRGNNQKWGEKPQENHNIEEAYSIWREIKDSHIDMNSFQNDRGGRNGEGDDEFKKKSI